MDPRPAHQRIAIASCPEYEHIGLHISAVGCGTNHEAQSRSHTRRPEGMGCFAMVAISSGTALLSSPAFGSTELAAPHFFWLFPETPHSYRPVSSFGHYWILFDGPVPRQWLERGLLDPQQAYQEPDARQRSSFERCWHAALSESQRGAGLAAACLLECLIRCRISGEGGQDSGDSLVNAVLSTLHKHCDQIPEGEELARRHGISYPSLRRRFRQATGTSIGQYLAQCRINLAKELLLGSEASIGEIAQRCGYSDPYYFSRVFRQHLGISPSGFRSTGL